MTDENDDRCTGVTPSEVVAMVVALIPDEALALGMSATAEKDPAPTRGYHIRLHLGEDSELVGGKALSVTLDDWRCSESGDLRTFVLVASSNLVRRWNAQR